jgi:hypothetical protein
VRRRAGRESIHRRYGRNRRWLGNCGEVPIISVFPPGLCWNLVTPKGGTKAPEGRQRVARGASPWTAAGRMYEPRSGDSNGARRVAVAPPGLCILNRRASRGSRPWLRAAAPPGLLPIPTFANQWGSRGRSVAAPPANHDRSIHPTSPGATAAAFDPGHETSAWPLTITIHFAIVAIYHPLH